MDFLVWTVISGLFVGALLGFVLQRGRFCLTGGFRDLVLSKDTRIFTALLIAICVQSIGVYVLIATDVVKFSPGVFSWLSTAFGSFVFGLGIILAGGCATGTWYRAGEGLIGSWIALVMYMVSSAVTRSPNLAPFVTAIKGFQTSDNAIATTLGVSIWYLIAILFAATMFFVTKEFKKPKLVVASLPARRTGIAHWLFEKRWNPFITAILVGIIALIAWPLSEATGRMSGLGITTPSADIVRFLVVGDQKFINWGVFLVIGIFLGSFIAAKGSREFRLRAADVKTSVHSFGGGILMGFGATLAGGCTIGNSLVMTAMMTWQGWTALVFTLLGVFVSARLVYLRRPAPSAPTLVPQLA